MDDMFRHLGIVVTGRNQASRLTGCLNSLALSKDRIVYVDLDSTDASADIAENQGVRTIRLQMGSSCKGRAMQAGLDDLCTRHPEVQYIQFVDCSFILQPGWLTLGLTFIEEYPRLAVVVGRIYERGAAVSWVRRAIDIEWDLPIYEAGIVSGTIMARVAAVREVHGWRTDLSAGLEEDLGVRARRAGWQLYRLPGDMAVHDMGGSGLRQFGRWATQSGIIHAQLAMMHGRQLCEHSFNRTCTNLFFGALMPLILAVCLPLGAPELAVIACLYFFLAFRSLRWRLGRGDTHRQALMYTAASVALRPAAAWGTLKVWLRRLAGRMPEPLPCEASETSQAR
jgi:GT2 family glycosyltransferase